MEGCISKTSATRPNIPGISAPEAYIQNGFNNTFNSIGFQTDIVIPTYRVTATASLPLFLVADSAFAVSTLFTYGYLEARLIGPATRYFR